MSDYLAVGGVSAVLMSLLGTALTDGGPITILGSASAITNKAPDLVTTGKDETAGLNLFLYYASINPALRNLNLPSMSAGRGRLEQSTAGHQSALPGDGVRKSRVRCGDSAGVGDEGVS